MPRQRRIDVPGLFYHVISRGMERRKIFRHDSDYKEFTDRLGLALEETGCKCYAWVLMGNHFHLLLRPLSHPLSHTMRKLMSGYAGFFNFKYKRTGGLFQNRFKSIICQEDSYFKELIRYIHLNPVRAGLMQTPAELAKYPWSGHGVLMGKQRKPWQDDSEVLGYFGATIRESRKRYLQFIKDGWGMGPRKDLMGGGLLRSAGGVAGVQQLKSSGRRWQFDTRILGDGEFVEEVLKMAGIEQEEKEKIRNRYTIDDLAEKVCEEFSITKKDLFSGSRTRSLTLPKGVFVFLANDYLKESYVKIGSMLKMRSSSAYQLRDRGCEYVEKGKNFLSI